MLNESFEEAIKYIQECDTLIVGGTSLSVYPAASLVRYFNGKHLVIINDMVTPYDNNADLVIHSSLGEVFSKIII